MTLEEFEKAMQASGYAVVLSQEDSRYYVVKNDGSQPVGVTQAKVTGSSYVSSSEEKKSFLASDLPVTVAQTIIAFSWTPIADREKPYLQVTFDDNKYWLSSVERPTDGQLVLKFEGASQNVSDDTVNEAIEIFNSFVAKSSQTGGAK
jgi:hypothetical protein